MNTLMLNADGLPISYLPLSVITWQESISYIVLEKARILEYYDDWVVRSQRWSTKVPAVMMLNNYRKPRNTVRFSKQGVFLRDEFVCQYCGISVNRRTATLDHVLPISHGGKTIWENCTTACGPCNSSKGNKFNIRPKNKPFKPNYYSLVDKRKRMSYDIRHPSWVNYL